MNPLASLLNTIFTSTALISCTALATLGIVIIFKTSNTTNFAQGSIAAFGAYVIGALVIRAGWPLWISVIFALIVGMVLGLLIDVVIFRNGRNVNAVGKQIITMGLVTIIIAIIPLIFGTNQDIQILPFMSGTLSFDVFGSTVSIQTQALVTLGIAAGVIAVIFLALRFTKWGLGVRATASSESTAGIMGINTHVVTSSSWAIAAGIGVLAAYLFAANSATLTSTFMTTIQVNSFLASILGGFSTFYGPIIGAVLIPLFGCFYGWIGGLNQSLVFFNDWRTVFTYLTLLIIILIKPQGLFGKRVLKKV